MDDLLDTYFQQPPPRIKDKNIYVKVLDAQYTRIFWWGLLAFPLLVLLLGILYLLYSLFMTDRLDEVKLFLGPTIRNADGTVLKAVKQLKGSDSTVYRYTFQFDHVNTQKKKTSVEAYCFSDKRIAEPGGQIKVDYLRYDPTIARIAGCRRTATSINNLFIVVFLLTLLSSLPLPIFLYQSKWVKKAIVNGEVITTAILDSQGYGYESPTCEIEFDYYDKRISSRAIVGYNKDKIMAGLVTEKKPARILFLPDSPEKCIILDLISQGHT